MAKKDTETTATEAVDTTPVAAQEPVEPTPAPMTSVDTALQAHWKAFLAKAEKAAEENGTLHIFNEQKARGEFDVIPDSFKVSHGIN